MTMIQHLNSLDEIVDKALTLDTATSHEVYYPDGEASRFHVIKNDVSKKEVCTISKRYSILQHKDALNLVLSGIQAIGITGGGIMRNYGDTIVAEMYFDNLTVRDHTQDGHINVGMRFTNSFNKSLGFSGSAFLWRQVCQNGMLANKLLPNAPSMSFKHMGNVIERIGDSVKEFVQGLVTVESSLLEIINESTQQVIKFENDENQLKFIIEQVGSERKAKQFIDIEPVELTMDKWSLYNVLTHFASHEDLSYPQYEKIHENAQKLLINPIKLN
ncbi:MAG: DUF932 domain-containing protein [Burkholderiales bacterium]|nr:DUF932 domain-containing protein [Burkholderiales bacterium]